jgi:hypothetical protein
LSLLPTRLLRNAYSLTPVLAGYRPVWIGDRRRPIEGAVAVRPLGEALPRRHPLDLRTVQDAGFEGPWSVLRLVTATLP